MNSRKKNVATASLLALTLCLGLNACTGTASGPGEAGSSASASSAKVDLKTQAEAKKTMDAFIAQIAVDLPTYESGLAGKKTDAEKNVVFDSSFKQSAAYLKPGAFTPEQTRVLIGSFAQLYIYDKSAKVESKESSYELSGDIATIKGTDFVLTLGGKVQEQQPSASGKTGKMTLSFEGEKWLISGFDTGQ